MGLLLIEKNDLISKNEVIEWEVAEAQEIIKQEQAAHLIAMSEGVERQDNLKKALEIEKKHILDVCLTFFTPAVSFSRLTFLGSKKLYYLTSFFWICDFFYVLQ